MLRPAVCPSVYLEQFPRNFTTFLEDLSRKSNPQNTYCCKNAQVYTRRPSVYLEQFPRKFTTFLEDLSRKSNPQNTYCCKNAQVYTRQPCFVLRGHFPVFVTVCVCLFLPATAPTIGPVRARYRTAYCAVRLSITVCSPPPSAALPRDLQILQSHSERRQAPCTAAGWHKASCLRLFHFTFTQLRSVCQSHRPTPSTTLFSIQRHLYKYI
jgi:hypothetical protein